MRLIDELLEDFDEHHISAAASPQQRITLQALDQCLLRYMLEESVAEECSLMVEEGSACFLLEEQLRVPARSIWLEWSSGPRCTARPSRFGLLMISAADGRSGEIHLFYRDWGKLGLIAPAIVHFDLRGELKVSEKRPNHYRLQHERAFSAGDLLEHAKLEVDPCWQSAKVQAFGHAEYMRLVGELGEFAWVHLPFAFAFFILLSSPAILKMRPTDYQRLNKARKKRGHKQLGDQIEVRLNLTSYLQDGGSADPSSSRLPSRRHLVRGHVVSRQGKAFWRSTHLRGAAGALLLKRTVTVQRT